MTWHSPGTTVAIILVAMAAVAAVEVAIPLHARERHHRAHLAPNLALTFLTFATNAVFNAMLVWTLAKLESRGFGLLSAFALPSAMTVLVTVLVLDFSFYVCHVAMHAIPSFWRYHRVHHADAAVDVTTTIRQHPGEGVIRYAFMAAFAIPLGASSVGFAVYRLASALSGLLEHANIRLPRRLDDALALAFTWANFHKVHHSRDPRYTNTNFSNLASLWDRLFGTFTPAAVGATIDHGLDEFDDPARQSTVGLLRLPFRPAGADRISTDSATVSAAPSS
jgi:sterol desaturase/sphingolipid hydroxylase (fatty acid hydroxylase superfamily)